MNLTQEQFANRIGVTYSTVNHWENGRRSPQPFLLARLVAMQAELDARADAPGSARFRDPPPGAAATEPARAVGSREISAIEREIHRMVERIVERFHPERVILFGSHARGQARPDSDVDLLVVMPIQGSKREAQLDVRKALRDIPMPKDVVVTTPEEFEWRQRVVGTIERPAAREGKVLYARR